MCCSVDWKGLCTDTAAESSEGEWSNTLWLFLERKFSVGTVFCERADHRKFNIKFSLKRQRLDLSNALLSLKRYWVGPDKYPKAGERLDFFNACHL